MKPVTTSPSVTVDFSRLADHPLSHDRIALFNSGLVTRGDLPARRRVLRRARTPSTCASTWAGAPSGCPGHGTRHHDRRRRSTYDFDETDDDRTTPQRRSTCGRTGRTATYPRRSRPDGADWRTMAVDDGLWVDMVRAIRRGRGRTRQSRSATTRSTTSQTCAMSAPPSRCSTPATSTDYLDLYRKTAPRDPFGRPDGAASAVRRWPPSRRTPHWLRAFLAVVIGEEPPTRLPFVPPLRHLRTARPRSTPCCVSSTSYPQLADVELHLNEYNSFAIDYPRGGLQDSYLLAAAFAADLDLLLGSPRLTRVSWAQFLDSGNDNYSGMIAIDGDVKPLYRAYEFYQSMPVDRRVVRVDGPEGVGVIASADDDPLRCSSGTGRSRGRAASRHRARGPLASSCSTHREIRPAAPLGDAPLRLERGAVALVSSPATTARHHADRAAHARTLRRAAHERLGGRRRDDRDHASRHRRRLVPPSRGLDLPRRLAGSSVTAVTPADGAPAAGEIRLAESTADGVRPCGSR